MEPLLDAPVLGALDGPLAEMLRRNLVPSSIKELGKRGYREVKVLPREAVRRMVADAAAQIIEERLRPAFEEERKRLQAEHAARLARLEGELAAARERLASAEKEREAARAEAHRAREAFGTMKAEFEAQLGAVLGDPHNFAALTPERRERRRKRAEARRRLKAELERLAKENRDLAAKLVEAERRARKDPAPQRPPDEAIAAQAAEPPLDPIVLERVARRSVGFGSREAAAGARISGSPPAGHLLPAIAGAPGAAGEAACKFARPAAMRSETQAGAADATTATEHRCEVVPGILAIVDRRLTAIEKKLDELLAGFAEQEGERAGPFAAQRGQRFRRPGLDPRDAQYAAKRAILRRLFEDNLKLRACAEGQHRNPASEAGGVRDAAGAELPAAAAGGGFRTGSSGRGP